MDALISETGPLAEKIEAAQYALARAIARANLTGDPLGQALEAMSESLGAQLALHQAAEATAEKQFAMVRARVAAIAAETTSSISSAIRADVVHELRAWTHRLDRSTAFKAALSLVAVALASGGAAYVAGRDAGRNKAVAVSTGLVAALATEPQQAAQWLELVRSNNINSAIRRCTPMKNASGHACLVPLWLSPPKEEGL
jgi:hypothetical protein